MAASKSLMQLSDTITELEIAIEKAQLMTSELSGDYFELTEESYIYYYHDRAGVFNHISLDYIFKIKELIKEARRLMDIVWGAAKAKEEQSKEKSPQSSR